MLTSDYAYWTDLKRDPERYRVEKEKIADQVIALLDRRYPGLAGQVEMRDVATPFTWERYTGNWRGSFEGWLITKKTLPPFHMSKTLPGLKNFYTWPGNGSNPAAVCPRPPCPAATSSRSSASEITEGS
jgi:phytoene dehydrogenase-like protein